MKDLLEIVRLHDYYDAIVVEGYDGVGKGKILEEISKSLGVTPYRPDYNLWQKYDHRQIDRWKISGFFWDVFSHFGKGPLQIMLFDRGVISGAVYNNDPNIAKDYKKLLRNMRVFHILVVCDKEDYIKFLKSRFPDIDEFRAEFMWEDCSNYEKRYREYFELSGVEYVIYKNKFDDSLSEDLATKCAGCGHYNYGICRHPKKNCEVDPNSPRCEYSNDAEVQDEIGTEMCSM